MTHYLLRGSEEDPSVHPAAPMEALRVVEAEVLVEVGLHLVDGLVPGGAAIHTEVLIEQGPVRVLDEAVGLGPADPSGPVLDVLELEEEFVGVRVGASAELAPIFGEDGSDLDAVLVEEGGDPWGSTPAESQADQVVGAVSGSYTPVGSLHSGRILSGHFGHARAPGTDPLDLLLPVRRPALPRTRKTPSRWPLYFFNGLLGDVTETRRPLGETPVPPGAPGWHIACSTRPRHGVGPGRESRLAPQQTCRRRPPGVLNEFA